MKLKNCWHKELICLRQQDTIWGQPGRVGVHRRPGGAPLPALGRIGKGSKTRQRCWCVSGGDDAQAGRAARPTAAEPRRPGRTVRRKRMGRRPMREVWGWGVSEAGAGRGGSRPRYEGRRRQTVGVAGGKGVGRSLDGRFREAGGGGESWGAEDRGRRGRRWSGRMTAAVEDEGTTMTMAADRGQKSC
jgi:hypothetical protein